MRTTLLCALILSISTSVRAAEPDCGQTSSPANGAVADLRQATEPATPKKGLWDSIRSGASSLGNRIGETVQQVKDQYAPTLEEKQAMELVNAMLAPDKLGGADRVFNQNDIARIVDALLRDPAVQQQIRDGIRQEAFRQASEKPALFRKMAFRIADRRTTPGTRAYQKHFPGYWAQGVSQARQRIRAELEQALADEGITPAEGQGTSGTPRSITLAELESFQEAAGTLKAYTERIPSTGAGQLDMSHGLSQKDISAALRMLPDPRG